MKKRIEIGPAVYTQNDGSKRHQVRRVGLFTDELVGLYDFDGNRLEMIAFHSDALLDVMKKIADMYTCAVATIVWRNLTWIYPTR